MTGTIFDLIEDKIPEGHEGFMAIAEKAPQPKENSFFNDINEYVKTILKGNIEGISRLGKAFGPLRNETKTQQQELEEQIQNLDKLLPTEDTFGQRAVRRGLREVPSMVALAPAAAAQAIPRTLIAGFLGEGAKDLGAPEWAQTALELTAYLGPDITKKLLSKGDNKEIIQSAKKLGLSDEELAPLLNSDFKKKWLSKLSLKRGSTQEALNQSNAGLSRSYAALQHSEEAKTSLSKNSTQRLILDFYDKLKSMPAEVRNKIREDFQDLIKSPITGESLMNFYADVNHNLGKDTKQLSLLKDPIKKAIGSISPQLEKDFSLVNDLKSKYYDISAKLKPNLVDDILTAGDALGVLGSFGASFLLGNYHGLTAFMTHAAARKVAQQMLINPHLQQLSSKTIEALNSNKWAIAKTLIDKTADEISKYSPESAKELKKLTEKEIKEFFSQKEEDRQQK